MVPVNVGALTGPLPGLTPYEQSIELSRLVLLSPFLLMERSWFAACCQHDLALAGIRGAASFSDPRPRHLRDGTVATPVYRGVVDPAINFRETGTHQGPLGHVAPRRSGDAWPGEGQVPRPAHRAPLSERALEQLGARPITADDDLADWLQDRPRSIGAVTSAPGNHRFRLTHWAGAATPTTSVAHPLSRTRPDRERPRRFQPN